MIELSKKFRKYGADFVQLYKDEEYWKPVPGYEGRYEVSDHGRVRSLNYRHTGQIRVLRPKKTRDYYLRINLCKDGVVKTFRVHRLVWTAFVGEIPEGYELDHINATPSDNRLSNLRCVTCKQNHENPITNQRHADACRAANKKRCSKSIVQLDKTTGQVIKRWECMHDVERELGIANGTISLCCNGQRKTAGGFRWIYFMPPALSPEKYEICLQVCPF